MRLSLLSLASGLCFVSFPGFAAPSSDVFARLPLRFEAVDAPTSQGQSWVAHGPGFGVGFNQDGTYFRLGDRSLKLTLEGGDRSASFEGLSKSATPANYFGRKFRSVDAFGRLRQAGVYPGIDIVYYGKGQSLEYDFELAPGADPSRIRMRFEGADNISLGPKGQVILALGDRQITQDPPVVYQRRASGEIVGVPSSYVAQADGSIGITLGAYDASRALVVDPTILFTGYLAGTSADVPVGIGHDKNGLIYIAGYTYSPDFALVGTAYTGFFTGTSRQVFTTVMNPLGTDVITYSGYFSGDFGDDLKAMTVDSEGVFYLAGVTDDFFFPVTPGGYLTSNGGVRRSFVSVVDTKIPGKDGLTYSTFFAGTKTDEPTGIAVANGKIYVTGFTSSDDYPVTANAYQSTRPGGTFDGFVAEFDPAQSGTASLVSSTYLGGTSQDIPRSIAVAAEGQVYVAGYTRSGDFPTTPSSFRPFYSGSGDAFLTKLDLIANAVPYSTFLGGSGQDQATKILVEPSGHVAVTGFTLSNDFPVTPNALQSSQAGNGDVFLTILDPAAQDFTTALVYSTYFGGTDGEVPYDLRRDAAGKYYLCGYTLSLDLPVQNALAPASYPGNSIDGFVAAIDPAASPLKALTYSSHITGPGYQVAYGVDVDAQGNIYVTGTALGDVFGGTGATPPPDSNLNVFLLVFKP
ncbi:MAG: cell surface glycoprotein (s-layer protein) related protein-like protein [Bryobacterales bacterium]|nr:cell surface glycoprotein (s-layer protein) related protein-like protein [Bryobacterales bacterium]